MDDSLLAPCNREEADYRILLHVQDAFSISEIRDTNMKTADSAVVMLTVSAVARMHGLAFTICNDTKHNVLHICKCYSNCYWEGEIRSSTHVSQLNWV